eukprot:TRINITY_DN10231_c0_g1_i1.p1 TRINITY_DN10231_c0_g1~~TRINITY_DN10231_c0_g1_i1.p1  ORF type:complete len:548 (+),score=93.22 TRINITY_DN10231_c0_g1_i1:68-1645(+)
MGGSSSSQKNESSKKCCAGSEMDTSSEYGTSTDEDDGRNPLPPRRTNRDYPVGPRPTRKTRGVPAGHAAQAVGLESEADTMCSASTDDPFSSPSWRPPPRGPIHMQPLPTYDRPRALVPRLHTSTLRSASAPAPPPVHDPAVDAAEAMVLEALGETRHGGGDWRTAQSRRQPEPDQWVDAEEQLDPPLYSRKPLMLEDEAWSPPPRPKQVSSGFANHQQRQWPSERWAQPQRYDPATADCAGRRTTAPPSHDLRHREPPRELQPPYQMHQDTPRSDVTTDSERLELNRRIHSLSSKIADVAQRLSIDISSASRAPSPTRGSGFAEFRSCAAQSMATATATGISAGGSASDSSALLHLQQQQQRRELLSPLPHQEVQTRTAAEPAPMWPHQRAVDIREPRQPQSPSGASSTGYAGVGGGVDALVRRDFANAAPSDFYGGSSSGEDFRSGVYEAQVRHRSRVSRQHPNPQPTGGSSRTGTDDVLRERIRRARARREQLAAQRESCMRKGEELRADLRRLRLAVGTDC